MKRKAAQRRGIQIPKEIGRHDHNAIEALHFLQKFIDASHFPTGARMFTALREAIRLIQEQHPVFGGSFFEGGGDVFLIVKHDTFTTLADFSARSQ